MSQLLNVSSVQYRPSLKDYLSLKGMLHVAVVIILALSIIWHFDSIFIIKTPLPMSVDHVQMESSTEYRQQIPYTNVELSAFQIKFGTNGRYNNGQLKVSLQRGRDELESWSVSTAQLVDNQYKKFNVSSPFLLDSSSPYFIVLKDEFTGLNNIALYTSSDDSKIEYGNANVLKNKSVSVIYEVIDPEQKAYYKKLIAAFLFIAVIITSYYVNPKNMKTSSYIIFMVCGILCFQIMDYTLFQNIAKTEYIKDWEQSQKNDLIGPADARQYAVNLDYYVHFDTLKVYLNGTNRENLSIKIVKNDGKIYFDNAITPNNIFGDGRIGKTAVFVYRQGKFTPGQYTVEIRNTGESPVEVSVTNEGNLNFGISNTTFIAGKIAIFVTAVLVLYTVLILILNCSHFELTAERWFLATIIPFSIVYMVLFTPTSQADSLDAHPVAAYRWSNKLLGYSENDIWKGRQEDAEFFQFLHSPYIGGGPGQYPALKNYSAVSNYARLKCEKPDIVSLPYTSDRMNYYSVFNYLPQVLGLTIGRLLNFSTVVSLYLAKIFILAIYISVIYRDIKKIPVGKWVMATVATLPTALNMSSAISYDPLVIVSSLSFITCIFRLREKRSACLYFETIFWCFIAGSVKGGGYIIMLLPLAFTLFDASHKRNSIFLIVGILEIGLFSVWLFDKLLPSIAGFQFGASGGIRLTTAYAIQQPLVYLNMVMKTYLVHADYLLIGVGGTHLAWYLSGFKNTIPALFIILFGLAGGIQSVFEKDNISLRKIDRLLFIAIVIVGLITVPAMLLKDNVYGASTIWGIQGRYYFPLLPLFYFAVTKFELHDSVKSSSKAIMRKGAAWMSVLACILVYYLMILYLTRAA